ncbi:MAG: DNA polymerase III subunit gamma/tau, partial [Clostridia bacterium]|nr:DNA polymerase III subunit gamma/tau [Clostridia bacterium]
MAHVSLYRRFRPTSWDKVIGQDHIVTTLVNQIKSDAVSHAYLFTGTRGTGKTSCAKIFARAVNCLDPQNGSPCGVCAHCLALAEPSNLDIIEMDAASNNGVDEIRELKENVQYPPTAAKYKVYIIDEVHMLSGAAFNALLKTLEEPPKHVIFILATTEVHKLPQTILSRCLRFDFRLVPKDKLVALLAEVFTETSYTFEKEALELLALHGEGSVRDTLSI